MRFSFLIAALAAASPALAGPDDWAAAHEACMASISSLDEASGCIGIYRDACSEERIRSNQDLADGQCMTGEAAEWDARLNRSWAAVKARLAGNAQGLRALTQAQKAWIAFRDAECAASAAIWEPEGTGAAAAGNCLLSMTAQRFIELEGIVEGNL